eukprot:CAMPEP_0172577298 /NCGR_PEP_ID=MMETSP1067-20121228/138161_1 /TAXON_ID=265564 ORGANISM="Thalassiosira punctigera, Strain Tpunct2005C2" /NCGR_SAMPLE_ID=MMETSP1067 /ASSEMBLY_ACC=CAM_ASM_000444 /LENGTH=271 /DNA_ID=CAMNT_0013369985 /DNA_START=1144 /DNA_END=1961 /DNA_ORIENTATION=-
MSRTCAFSSLNCLRQGQAARRPPQYKVRTILLESKEQALLHGAKQQPLLLRSEEQARLLRSEEQDLSWSTIFEKSRQMSAPLATKSFRAPTGDASTSGSLRSTTIAALVPSLPFSVPRDGGLAPRGAEARGRMFALICVERLKLERRRGPGGEAREGRPGRVVITASSASSSSSRRAESGSNLRGGEAWEGSRNCLFGFFFLFSSSPFETAASTLDPLSAAWDRSEKLTPDYDEEDFENDPLPPTSRGEMRLFLRLSPDPFLLSYPSSSSS